MGKLELETFLTSLAVERNVSASTQPQALSALLFLYKEVLGLEFPWLDSVTRAKKPVRLPTVLTADEVKRLFEYLDDPLMDLIVRLLYGTGMRLLECLRLRMKDVEFTRREIVVREGKGNKDRVTMLPDSLSGPLARTDGLRERPAYAGFGGGARRGMVAGRLGGEVPQCGQSTGLEACRT
jgi:integrase